MTTARGTATLTLPVALTARLTELCGSNHVALRKQFVVNESGEAEITDILDFDRELRVACELPDPDSITLPDQGSIGPAVENWCMRHGRIYLNRLRFRQFYNEVWIDLASKHYLFNPIEGRHSY